MVFTGGAADTCAGGTMIAVIVGDRVGVYDGLEYGAMLTRKRNVTAEVE